MMRVTRGVLSMVVRSIGEVLAGAGQQTGDFLIDAGNAVRGAVCTIYRTNPSLIVRDPEKGFGKGLMDTLCPLSNPGSGGIGAPSVPFQGGQCCDSVYDVSYTVVTNVGTPQENTLTNTVEVTGAVNGGMKSKPHEPNPTNVTYFIEVLDCMGGSTEVIVVANTVPNTATAVIDSVVLVSGSDDCGNPPAGYPPSRNVYPPSSAPSDVTVVSPTDSFGVTIPLVYAPISPTFDIDPVLNFDLGGITLKVDFGGFEFGTGDGGGGAPDAATPEDLTPLQNGIDGLDSKLDDLLECACPPEPEPAELTVNVSNIVDSFKVSGVDLYRASIDVTKDPDKMQFGGSSGQTVKFAGWYSVELVDGYLPREQINFGSSAISVPENARGLTVTFTNGALGRVTWITRNA